MPLSKPITTLFMLMSADGKISTGNSDALDFDKDLPNIKGVKEGLQQYYDLEQQTDACSLNTGRVMAKIGVNNREEEPEKIPVDFVIVDNQPHLTEKGIDYLSKWVRTLCLVTTNKEHPAISSDLENVQVIEFENKIDFQELFRRLKEEHEIERMTIQSGGTLNAELLRTGLIDKLSIVVAPVVVGGKETSTLIDGPSLLNIDELTKIKTLELEEVKQLDHSYLHLKYHLIPGNLE